MSTEGYKSSQGWATNVMLCGPTDVWEWTEVIKASDPLFIGAWELWSWGSADSCWDQLMYLLLQRYQSSLPDMGKSAKKTPQYNHNHNYKNGSWSVCLFGKCHIICAISYKRFWRSLLSVFDFFGKLYRGNWVYIIDFWKKNYNFVFQHAKSFRAIQVFYSKTFHSPSSCKWYVKKAFKIVTR